VLAADLSDEHEAERLRAKVSEQAGAVDVLVNNAGLGDSVLFDHAEWTRTGKSCGTTYLPCPAYRNIGARHGGARPAECSTSALPPPKHALVQAGDDPIRGTKVGRALTPAIEDQQLMPDQHGFGENGTESPGFASRARVTIK